MKLTGKMDDILRQLRILRHNNGGATALNEVKYV